jgi:hypothetical protein
MGDQLVNAVDNRDPTRGDVGVGFALHRLPAIGPEPGLVSRHRDDRHQLEAPVIVLDQLELRVRAIEMETAPEIGRKGDRAACLDGKDVRLHALQHNGITALVNLPWRAIIAPGAHLRLICGFAFASANYAMRSRGPEGKAGR